MLGNKSWAVSSERIQAVRLLSIQLHRYSLLRDSDVPW